MRVLFISYDGMTDNLGASQVMPYLRGISLAGHQITLLSCEKPERSKRMPDVAALLAKSKISWRPLIYHKRPPILSTIFDAYCLFRTAYKICREEKIAVVHCRSYIAALVGLALKGRFGMALIFDMRGFWADERVDGGLWNLRNPLFALVYYFFKRKEAQLLKAADSSICLTEAGKREMLSWPVYRSGEAKESRISVIPCCADMEHFDPAKVSSIQASVWRAKLQLEESDLVLVYLGSLGTWYLLDPMLELFRRVAEVEPRARLLFITPEDHACVYERGAALGIGQHQLRAVDVARADVPEILSVCDLGVFFIKPTYSKISSSATKLAELFAMGLPVITNAGVGDHEQIFSIGGLGHLLADFSPESMSQAAVAALHFGKTDRKAVRDFARENFALERGVASYLKVYAELESRGHVRYL